MFFFFSPGFGDRARMIVGRRLLQRNNQIRMGWCKQGWRWDDSGASTTSKWRSCKIVRGKGDDMGDDHGMTFSDLQFFYFIIHPNHPTLLDDLFPEWDDHPAKHLSSNTYEQAWLRWSWKGQKRNIFEHRGNQIEDPDSKTNILRSKSSR